MFVTFFIIKSEKRVKVNEWSVLSSDTTMMSKATKMFRESGYWNLCRSRCCRRCLSFLKSYIRYYQHYACSEKDTIKFPVFSYGHLKTIGIQYVNLLPRNEVHLTIRVDAYNFENGGKVSVFKKKYRDTCERGLIYGITPKSVVIHRMQIWRASRSARV